MKVIGTYVYVKSQQQVDSVIEFYENYHSLDFDRICKLQLDDYSNKFPYMVLNNDGVFCNYAYIEDEDNLTKINFSDVVKLIS